VRRGMCPFYEKYKVASKLGVAGLVVVDSEPLGPKGLITLTGAPESDKSEDALVVAEGAWRRALGDGREADCGESTSG